MRPSIRELLAEVRTLDELQSVGRLYGPKAVTMQIEALFTRAVEDRWSVDELHFGVMSAVDRMVEAQEAIAERRLELGAGMSCAPSAKLSTTEALSAPPATAQGGRGPWAIPSSALPRS